MSFWDRSNAPPELIAWAEPARHIPIQNELARRSLWSKDLARDRGAPCPVCGGTDRFSANVRKQFWLCRGCKKSGKNAIDLVQFIDRVNFIDAVTILVGPPPRRNWRAATKAPGPAILAETRRLAEEKRKAYENNARAEENMRRLASLKMWAEAGPVDNSGLVARYLREERKISLSPDDWKYLSPRVIRFHPRCPFGKEGEGERKKTVYLPAMICLYRDIRTDSPLAIHRTALTPDAQKIDRLTLGPIVGAAIKLDADEDVEQGLIIGEGVETCLTARMAGLRPVWAMGPVGGIERFPVLPGLDGLTLLAEAGEPSQKAIQACGTRWDNAGRTVIQAITSRFGPERCIAGTRPMREWAKLPNRFPQSSPRETDELEAEHVAPRADAKPQVTPEPGEELATTEIFRKVNGHAGPAAVEPELKIYSADVLARTPASERQWLVPGMIPMSCVTLFYGNGGEGKSLLEIQLAIAVASGTGWIGKLPKQGRALVLSCEDPISEVRRRVRDITAGREDINLDDLAALKIVDLAGEDAVLAFLENHGTTLKTSALFARIEREVEKQRPAMLGIDTLADVYGGDENIRGQVRQFLGFLTSLAIKYDMAVVVLAHPSLSGITSGSGTGGSTAWNNSVRSRLYLAPMKSGDSDEPDPSLKQLSVKKSNYGAIGEAIPLRWQCGRFVLMPGGSGFDHIALEARAKDAFLNLIKKYRREDRDVSPNKGPTYAPATFSRHPDAAGLSSKVLEKAMNRLLDDKKIRIEKFGPPSKQRSKIVPIDEIEAE